MLVHEEWGRSQLPDHAKRWVCDSNLKAWTGFSVSEPYIYYNTEALSCRPVLAPSSACLCLGCWGLEMDGYHFPHGSLGPGWPGFPNIWCTRVPASLASESAFFRQPWPGAVKLQAEWVGWLRIGCLPRCRRKLVCHLWLSPGVTHTGSCNWDVCPWCLFLLHFLIPEALPPCTLWLNMQPLSSLTQPRAPHSPLFDLTNPSNLPLQDSHLSVLFFSGNDWKNLFTLRPHEVISV